MREDHQSADLRAQSPLAHILVLYDGRVFTKTRGVCTWLEGQYPEPKLMGLDVTERAFIEMPDRRMAWCWLLPMAHCVRHPHPDLARA